MMKTVLLLLFTMHQMFLISSALKCYECSEDCSAPKEVDCASEVTCCFSSVDAPGGEEATTVAARMKRSAVHPTPEASVTRRVHFTKFLEDAAAATDHKYKGCCTDKTKKETCNTDKCYVCEADLCNKGNTASSATSVLASILNVLLPLTIIGVAIGSPKKFIN